MKNANADFDIYTQFSVLLIHFDFLMYLFRNLRQIYYYVFAHIMQIVLGSLQKNVKNSFLSKRNHICLLFSTA